VVGFCAVRIVAFCSAGRIRTHGFGLGNAAIGYLIELFGEPGWDRTNDHLIKSQTSTTLGRQH
jgi:hypothetical protein